MRCLLDEVYSSTDVGSYGVVKKPEHLYCGFHGAVGSLVQNHTNRYTKNRDVSHLVDDVVHKRHYGFHNWLHV